MMVDLLLLILAVGMYGLSPWETINLINGELE